MSSEIDARGLACPAPVLQTKAVIDSDNPAFIMNSEAHARDHTLEVQLPFLQTVLEPGFKILPILFGNTDRDGYKILAQSLQEHLSDDDIVVVSTDLSHYPGYSDANEIDPITLDNIQTLDVLKLDDNDLILQIQKNLLLEFQKKHP